ncbi:hypothetical protein ACOMHN_034897 [Nucella lapillus]
MSACLHALQWDVRLSACLHALQWDDDCPPVYTRCNGMYDCPPVYTRCNGMYDCPPVYTRCNGMYDCPPVYTRCNGMYDCVRRQDEGGCEGMTCPGYFRCRDSMLCVHTDLICDGWSHCPRNDDELVCDVICPMNCQCEGHTFLCPRPFPACLYPQLRFLDASCSGMTLNDVSNNTLLCRVYRLLCGGPPPHPDPDSPPPLIALSAGQPGVGHQSALTTLDLSHTSLTVLDASALSPFPHLHMLNLTSSLIHTISATGFQFTPASCELYLDDAPLKTFPPDFLQDLARLRFVSTQNYKLCCRRVLPVNFDAACFAPKDISSCEDLLQSWTYRGFLWLMGCLSVTGSIFCCCSRLFLKSLASSSGYSAFVTNLTMADLLMGVYITIIGAADQRFRGRYLFNDDTWKNSVTCKMAGFLSLLSCEVSALIIWFITLDRFIVLRFLSSTLKDQRRSGGVRAAAISPFLYTLNTLAEKRNKRNEAKLLQWLESNPDSVH